MSSIGRLRSMRARNLEVESVREPCGAKTSLDRFVKCAAHELAADQQTLLLELCSARIAAIAHPFAHSLSWVAERLSFFSL